MDSPMGSEDPYSSSEPFQSVALSVSLCWMGGKVERGEDEPETSSSASSTMNFLRLGMMAI